MKDIRSFQDEYRFLSNFYPSPLTFRGRDYPTAEHAYQSSKFTDEGIAEAIRQASTPGRAKRLGRTPLPLVPGWDAGIRVTVMTEILVAKFLASEDLGQRLLDTGSALLVEGNHWHDNTWGDCNCSPCENTPGLNLLGRTLMNVRDAI